MSFSPNHQFSIVEQFGENGQHIVYLKDLKIGTKREIARYDRHARAIWSPNSRRIAWTDYAGSDSSECSVIDTDEKAAIVSVMELVQARVSHEERKRITSNDHLYVAALGWTSSSLLKVKVWGYGNGKEFSRIYTVKIATN